MTHLQDQHVLILGLGASGLAMARWCLRMGARVTVADTRVEPPELPALRAQAPQVTVIHGEFSAALIEGTDIRAVFKSPGLTPSEVAPVFVAAKAIGIWTSGELGLFSSALSNLKLTQGYAPKVIAITGTNGKTTVTALTGLLVDRAGWSVAVAGNIGPSLLDTLAQRIDENLLPQAWVLELSSFQLDGVTDFEASAATVLNITQDHLDWHGDMVAYTRAKAQIFAGSGTMLLCRDDAAVMALQPPPPKSKADKTPARSVVTFGADMPLRAGDYGIETVSGMTWLVRAHPADETRKRRAADQEEIHIQRLMPADALRIRGRHNATNALAALALASAIGCPLAPMLYGLREYRGEPHRVAPVGAVDGVAYFNDSKGTNVGATVAALVGIGEAFDSHSNQKIVVILGGVGKGQDFSPLAAPVSRYARAVVLIGRDAATISQTLQTTAVPLHPASSLADAVAISARCAHAGDAVLMSPACASFDMFDNYKQRGEQFEAQVAAWAHANGQLLEGAT